MLGKRSEDQNSKAEEHRATRGTRGDPSIVSRDMRIIGDCETDGRLRIEGDVTGNVAAGELEVAASGSVDGDIVVRDGREGGAGIVVQGHVTGGIRGKKVQVASGGAVDGGVVADEAIVHGRVQGGILARTRLVLEETAEVEGDVHARRLALQEGGQVNGTIRMGEQIADTEPGKGSAWSGIAPSSPDRNEAAASAEGDPTGGKAGSPTSGSKRDESENKKSKKDKSKKEQKDEGAEGSAAAEG